LALAAVVIGGVLLAQRFILSNGVEEPELAARAEPPEQSKRVERTALESKPSPSVTPVPSVPSIGATASREPPGESRKAPPSVTPVSPPPPALPSEPSPVPQRRLQPPPAPKPTSQAGGSTGRSAPPPREPALASEEPSWGGAPSSEPASKERDEKQPAAAPSGVSSVSATPAEATEDSVPAESPKPVEPPVVPPSNVPEEARAFANEQAQQQLAAAANEASRCASLGTTRGSGKVNVSIATWGRVVRVTHLNQAFVGTPVGVCVMEAFQKVQVPPFDGATQTVTGSFVIQ
jgi:hypothetical protein